MDGQLMASVVVGFCIGGVVAGMQDLEHIGRGLFGIFEPRVAVQVTGSIIGVLAGFSLGWGLRGLYLALGLALACLLTAVIAGFFCEYRGWRGYLLGGSIGAALTAVAYSLIVPM